MQKAVAFWGGVLALGLSLSAWAGPTPQGPSFHISSCTTCIQQFPAVAGFRPVPSCPSGRGRARPIPTASAGRSSPAWEIPGARISWPTRTWLGDQYDPAVAARRAGKFHRGGRRSTATARSRAGAIRRTARRWAPPSRSTRIRPGRRPSPADFIPAVAALKDGFIVAWISFLPAGNGFPGTTPRCWPAS